MSTSAFKGDHPFVWTAWSQVISCHKGRNGMGRQAYPYRVPHAVHLPLIPGTDPGTRPSTRHPHSSIQRQHISSSRISIPLPQAYYGTGPAGDPSRQRAPISRACSGTNLAMATSCFDFRSSPLTVMVSGCGGPGPGSRQGHAKGGGQDEMEGHGQQLGRGCPAPHCVLAGCLGG